MVKSAVLFLVVLCAVSSVLSHGHHHRRHRKNKKETRCGVQHYTFQETGYRQECHQVYESHCEEVYRDHCEDVVQYREECVSQPHHLHPDPHQAYLGYNQLARQCHQVPQHHQVCHKVPEKICRDHPRQECRQVPVSVPRTAARRVCHRY